MRLHRTRSTLWIMIAVSLMLTCFAQETTPELPEGLTYGDIRTQQASSTPIRSRCKLGTSIVTQATPLGDARYLLALNPSLQSDSAIYSIYDAEKGEIVWRSPHLFPVLAVPGAVTFKTLGPDKGLTALVSVDSSGKERWRSQLGHRIKQVFPLGNGDLLVSNLPVGPEVTAVRDTDGKIHWKLNADDTSTVKGIHAIHLAGGELYGAGTGFFARISSETGKPVWIQASLGLEPRHPAPRGNNGDLYVVTKDRELVQLNAEDGTVRWRHPFPEGSKINNTFLIENEIFVRGTAAASGEKPGTNWLTRLSPDGKRLWTFTDDAPVISNLAISNDRLYAASPMELMAWKRSTGELLYRKQYASSPSSYPPSVYAFENQVVVAGELAVVGFDPENGTQQYRHGFDPVLKNGSVMLLDRSIAKLSSQKGPGKFQYSYHTNFFYESSRINQERSNALWASHRSKISQGRMSLDSIYARSAARQAKTDAMMTVYSAAIDNILAYEAAGLAIASQKDRKLLARRRTIRATILGGFPEMLAGEYVFRPIRIHDNSNPFVPGGAFMAVAVVHLPTGKKKITPLSPVYGDYGLWLMLDPENGQIFHQGIGLDPSAYSRTYRNGKWTFESALICQPLPLP